MENQLIQLYLFICQTYDTYSDTCFQRLSNNSEPRFTDQELVAIYLFATMKRDGKVKGPASTAAVPIDPRERAPSSFLDEAARLAETGDLREALRALYLATLVSLDRRRMIAFDPHLTNWQYMRQLPRGGMRDSFGQFTRVFDHTWYGREETTYVLYERCRGLAREIVEAP